MIAWFKKTFLFFRIWFEFGPLYATFFLHPEWFPTPDEFSSRFSDFCCMLADEEVLS